MNPTNLRVLARGVVGRHEAGGDRQSCAFPYVSVLPDGRWLVSWRAGPTKAGTVGQHVLVSWSDDAGRTWAAPTRPFTALAIGGRPGLFRAAGFTPLGGRRVLATLCWVDHSDPALPFYNEATEGLLDTRLFLARSDDGGETWTPPTQIHTAPFTDPTPITGPTLLLANGDLACQFEMNKPYRDPTPWRHRSVLLYSRDGGHTWPEHAVVSDHPTIFYWDQRPAVLPDGSVLDVFWTYDRVATHYLNIHARRSNDHGRTWSPLWDCGVPGQPAPVVALGGGELAMAYMDRTAAPVLKLRRSADSGRTWPAATELVVRRLDDRPQADAKVNMQEAWAEMAKFSLGLPHTAPLPDGGLLVVYYVGPHTEATDVEWARLGPG